MTVCTGYGFLLSYEQLDSIVECFQNGGYDDFDMVCIPCIRSDWREPLLFMSSYDSVINKYNMDDFEIVHNISKLEGSQKLEKLAEKHEKEINVYAVNYEGDDIFGDDEKGLRLFRKAIKKYEKYQENTKIAKEKRDKEEVLQYKRLKFDWTIAHMRKNSQPYCLKDFDIECLSIGESMEKDGIYAQPVSYKDEMEDALFHIRNVKYTAFLCPDGYKLFFESEKIEGTMKRIMDKFDCKYIQIVIGGDKMITGSDKKIVLRGLNKLLMGNNGDELDLNVLETHETISCVVEIPYVFNNGTGRTLRVQVVQALVK